MKRCHMEVGFKGLSHKRCFDGSEIQKWIPVQECKRSRGVRGRVQGTNPGAWKPICLAQLH